MSKLGMITLLFLFILFFASDVLAKPKIECGVTVRYSERTQARSASADTADVCFKNAIQSGCNMICTRTGDASENCQNRCIRTAKLDVTACRAHAGMDCATDLEKTRKSLLVPASNSVRSKVPRLPANAPKKRSAAKNDYLILAKKTPAKTPLLMDNSRYAKRKKGAGTGELLKVNAVSDTSKTAKKASARPSDHKKRRSSQTHHQPLLFPF